MEFTTVTDGPCLHVTTGWVYGVVDGHCIELLGT